MNKRSCQALVSLFFLVTLLGCSPSPIFAPTVLVPTPITTLTHSPTTTLEPSLTSTPTPIRTLIPTHAFQEKDSPEIKAFKPSANCPNICWKGIHPGTTSAGQAISILMGSKDMGEIQISDNRILATWFPDRTRKYPNRLGVSIAFSSNVVESISFVSTGSINSVGDFMSLLGEPDRLKIYHTCLSECYSDYILFYSAMSVALYVNHGSGTGPASDDFITKITINLPVEDPNIFQPWLGYGHLEDYSRNPMPSSTPYP